MLNEINMVFVPQLLACLHAHLFTEMRVSGVVGDICTAWGNDLEGASGQGSIHPQLIILPLNSLVSGALHKQTDLVLTSCFNVRLQA